MSSTREQIPLCRKSAKRGPVDDPSESQPSKWLKPSIKLHSAAFYDALPKVWLTRRALKELDRRTSQANSPQRPASTPRRVSRNTWNKIQSFARHGGPELRDLRGYPAPRNITRTMSSNRFPGSGVPMSASSSIKRSSTYDNNFEQQIIGHKIYPEGYEYPDGRQTPEPELEGFHQRLAQSRASLSPSRWPDSKFRDFRQKNARVLNEGEVMRDLLPIICGKADIPSKQDLLFTRLDSITNDTTVNAKPDFYDGARLEDIDKQVRDDLGPFIIPTGHRTAPVAPNFFLEAKGPKGSADVAKRQACYNGALGARAMHKLQSYKQEPIFDGNAYTITSTYLAGAGTLQMYATHPTQAEDATTEYHMTQLKGWALTGDPDTFRQGATAFRNARDWAQEKRDAFISAANERARPVNVDPSFESFDHDDVPDPAEVQDATRPTQADDSEDDPDYMSQQVSQGGYEPSDVASDYDGLSDITEVQRVGQSGPSAGYDGAGPTPESSGPSQTTDTPPAEDSETSPDELALDAYPIRTSGKKRRNRRSEETVSKAPRQSDGKSGR